MARYQSSRLLPTILTLIVIIIAIAGLVTLIRLVFFSGSSSNDQSQVNTAQAALLTTDPSSSVSMTVRGPIVADENFHSYQIVVSPNSRSIKTFNGYLDTVVSQQDLSNNTAAYDQFVHALDKANLAAGKPLQGDKDNTSGVCATGRVYEFTITKDSQPLETLWTSTCNGSPGSLRASVTQVSQLFINQIPNGSNLVSQVSLSL
ncbi:MAG TPA: hypothetical protein VN081_00070 [Dongiaceae bacterium]|nr:hypothetical protein [Dongiaceae bacterium]